MSYTSDFFETTEAVRMVVTPEPYVTRVVMANGSVINFDPDPPEAERVRGTRGGLRYHTPADDDRPDNFYDVDAADD